MQQQMLEGLPKSFQPRLGKHEDSKVESSPIAPVDDWRYNLEESTEEVIGTEERA
jgi:hypothetical protein